MYCDSESLILTINFIMKQETLSALEEHYALLAAAAVDQFFPPRNINDTLSVLAALNYLNTVVKKPGGRRVTSYYYIKGMAACLFLHLLYRPIQGVAIYWSESDGVTYFRVKNWQFSFHYVPYLVYYANVIDEKELTPQQWDGIRLQEMAMTILRLCCPTDLKADESAMTRMMLFNKKDMVSRLNISLPQEDSNLINNAKTKEKAKISSRCRYVREARNRRMREARCRRGDRQDSLKALALALTFRIESTHCFELYRRKDDRRLKVMRYTGRNYNELQQYLTNHVSKVMYRGQETLKPGYFYFVHRRYRCLWFMKPSKYIYYIAQNNYLKCEGHYYNLCLTYDIVRWLAQLYPMLRFINIMNFNRMTNQRRYYTYNALLRVPLRSKARRLKVWLIVDKEGLLSDRLVRFMPANIINDYCTTSDSYVNYEVTHQDGKEGIYAYKHIHLLKPIYKKVIIKNYFAQVMDSNNRWAIYALLKERFETEFIYDHIWYDDNKRAILGKIHNNVIAIKTFKAEQALD